jgi:outer membrane receptor for ferrienterochelin and colicin
MFRRFLLPLLFITIASAALAQTGTISGVVKDAKTEEVVVGANVILQGTSVGAMTDVNGIYTIPNVKPGTYNLVISFVTYKSHIVPDVLVEDAKITNIDVAMVEDAQQLEEIVVQGTREINTDLAMVSAIKESKLVVTGISAQQISKSQDRDAAQVVRRVPGVTLVDNRFVIVRGLASRYTTVLLNGVVAPSTETDSRAFSFDIVPSGLLDRMLVHKSGAAHLPGDFAGSIVGVNTKTAIENNFTNISLSGGVRVNTTFNTFITQERSSTEFLGFGGSLRKLPSGAPANYNALGTDVNRIEAESRKFNNSWGTTSSTAIPDIRFSVDLGRTFYIREMKVNTVSSLSYSNTNQYNKITFNRYSNYSNSVGLPYFAFQDDQYNNNVRLGVLSNWAFHVSPNSKIEFKNLYTRLGSSISTFRTGTDIDKGQDVRNGSFRYIERSIYTGQLEGKHTLTKDKSAISWILGYTSASRNEPDWKRYSYRRNSGTENDFELFVPTNAANPANAARFYQKLNEFNVTNRLDFDYKFNVGSGEKQYELKLGYWVEYKNRAFAARQIGFVQRGDIDLSTFKLPIDQIFVPENIAYQNGFSVAESTNITDSYDANALLAAGYVSVDMPISDVIRFVPGFRVEHNTIHLETPKGTGGAEIDYPVTSMLPFANLSFNLNMRSLIRLAYSKTINRPEFRELAPFSFYDFDAQLDIVGNKELKVADIHNVDLRWEYYPTPDEFISVGAFYKNFRNPIETRIVTGANNPIQFYQNAKGANNAGVEVEVRKSIAYSSPSKFLNDLSVIFNASYIMSEIELNDDGTLTEKVRRPMQGQSPYVINAGLYYQNDESGLQISSQYNVFGKRIAFVGDQEFPTQWEMPRHVVDLTISKTIGERTELRFGVSDLLNAPLILKEDANLDNKLDNANSDRLVRETRNGQYFNLGVVMKL